MLADFVLAARYMDYGNTYAGGGKKPHDNDEETAKELERLLPQAA